MSEAKHTPGPWSVQDGDVWSGDDGPVGVPLVRSAREYRRWGREVSIEEHEANACLIAAAPDLLSALEMRLRNHDWDCASMGKIEPRGACDCGIESGRIAIAKATGTS